MNKHFLTPPMLILVFLSLTTVSYADSSAWGMRWFVPLGDIGNSSLWLNFTLGDLGDSMPENICFGLNGTGLCVGNALQDLDMELKDIFNVSRLVFSDGEEITSTAFGSMEIYADNDIYLYPDGEVIIDADVNPATNLARNLGSLTTMWKRLFVGDVIADGYISANSINVTGDITANMFNGSWNESKNYQPLLQNSSNITCVGNQCWYNGTTGGTGDYLNLSGTNANQNINISPYNLTANDIIIPDWSLNNGLGSVNDFFRLFTSAGRITGGEITSKGDGTVNVTVGTGVIRIADDDVSQIKFFNWSGNLSIPIPEGISYIGIDYNGGNPHIVRMNTDVWDLDTNFPLGTVINQSGDLYVLNDPWWVGDGLTNVIERFQGEGTERDDEIGGLIVGTTGRNITLTGGKVWARLNEFDISSKDTSDGDTFYSFYRDGAGSWTRTGVHTKYNNTHYDDGDGVPELMNNNYYANIWVFVEIETEDSGHLMTIFPQNQYSNVASAENEPVPDFPSAWYKHGIFLGRILFKKDGISSISTDTVYTTTFTSSQAGIHNNLAGLQGGVASQYYHLTATEYIKLQAGYPSNADLKNNLTALNESVKDYVYNGTFQTMADTATNFTNYNSSIWDKVILWFNDKKDYWNTTNLLNGTLTKKTDVDTWISSNSTADRTYTDTRVDSIENFTTQDINDSIGNHSQWLSSVPNLDIDSTNDITTSGGTITGNLVINGILTLIGDLFNATVTEQYLNGSFLPSITDTFNIGSIDLKWNKIYSNELVGDLDCSNITNANYDVCVNPNTDTQLSDSDILALGYNHTDDIKTWVDSNDDDTIYDDTNVRQSIIDNSTADKSYTDSRVDSMSNYTGEGAYDSDNFSVDYNAETGRYTSTNFTVDHNTATHSYINNCSVDGSCDLITYDGELTYTSLEGLDIVNQTMLDNATIIRTDNTTWLDLWYSTIEAFNNINFTAQYNLMGFWTDRNFSNSLSLRTNITYDEEVTDWISGNITNLNESVKDYVYNGTFARCVNTSNTTCINGEITYNGTTGTSGSAGIWTNETRIEEPLGVATFNGEVNISNNNMEYFIRDGIEYYYRLVS